MTILARPPPPDRIGRPQKALAVHLSRRTREQAISLLSYRHKCNPSTPFFCRRVSSPTREPLGNPLDEYLKVRRDTHGGVKPPCAVESVPKFAVLRRVGHSVGWTPMKSRSAMSVIWYRAVHTPSAQNEIHPQWGQSPSPQALRHGPA